MAVKQPVLPYEIEAFEPAESGAYEIEAYEPIADDWSDDLLSAAARSRIGTSERRMEDVALGQGEAAAPIAQRPPTPARGSQIDPTVSARVLSAAPRKVLGGLYRGTALGAGGILRAYAELVGDDSLAEMAAHFAPIDAAIADDISGRVSPDAGVIERGVSSGLESVGAMAPGLVASIIAKSPTPMLAIMGAQTGGTAYGTARDEGVQPSTARGYAAAHAAIEVITEKIPAHRLVKALAENQAFSQMVMGQLAAEIPGEQVATVTQNFMDWAVLPSNKNKTPADYVLEQPSAMAETLVATIVATALQSGAANLAQKAAGQQEEEAAPPPPPEAAAPVVPPAGLPELVANDPEAEAAFNESRVESVGEPYPIEAYEPMEDLGAAAATLRTEDPDIDRKAGEMAARAGEVLEPEQPQLTPEELAKWVEEHENRPPSAEQQAASGVVDYSQEPPDTLEGTVTASEDVTPKPERKALPEPVAPTAAEKERAEKPVEDMTDDELAALVIEDVEEEEAANGEETTETAEVLTKAQTRNRELTRQFEAAKAAVAGLGIPDLKVGGVTEDGVTVNYIAKGPEGSATFKTRIFDIRDIEQDPEYVRTWAKGVTAQNEGRIAQAVEKPGPGRSEEVLQERGSYGLYRVTDDRGGFIVRGPESARHYTVEGNARAAFEAGARPDPLPGESRDEFKRRRAFSDKETDAAWKAFEANKAGPTVTHNPRHGSVEIKFPAKPSDEVRAKLKSVGYRWAKTTGTWYKKPGKGITPEREIAEVHEMLGMAKADAPTARTEAAEQPANVKTWLAGRESGATPGEVATAIFGNDLQMAQRALTSLLQSGQIDARSETRGGRAVTVYLAKGKMGPTPQVEALPGTAVRLPSFVTGQQRKPPIERDPTGKVVSDGPPAPKAKPPGEFRFYPKDTKVEYFNAGDKKWHETTTIADTNAEGVTSIWHPTMRMQAMWPPGATPQRVKLAVSDADLRPVGEKAPAPQAPRVIKEGTAGDSVADIAAATQNQLDERKAANKAKRDELLKKLKADLHNINVGVDPTHVATMIGIVRTYLDDGVVEARKAAIALQADWQSLTGESFPEKLRKYFAAAWKRLRSEAIDVDAVFAKAQDRVEETGDDGNTDVVRVDAGRVPKSERGAAQPGGDRGGDVLAPVSPEAVEAARPETGSTDPEAVAPAGVPDSGRPDEVTYVESGSAPRPVQGRPVSPSGASSEPGSRPPDYALTPERLQAIVQRGGMTRARDNLAAMKLAKQIREEQRFATADEQDTLAKYVGWGDSELAQFLETSARYGWKPTEKAIWQELRDVTTEAERKALAGSTLNAHYTYDLYVPIWEALVEHGFAGGRVLEPAVGVGHAFGSMPSQIREASSLNAVELEPLTATIAQALYPSARVQQTGYEQSRIPTGTQDLIISNVPFGKYGVLDRLMPDYITESIHNYFFAKALEHARPGGLVVFVTSRFTMDSQPAGRVRKYLMERAEFVGAVRMPSTAFGKTAKTEVITDLIVLRKLREGEKAQNAKLFIEAPLNEALSTTQLGARGKTVEVNVYRSSWYDAHPELVLGKESVAGTMYGGRGEYTVEGTKGESISGPLRKALGAILKPGAYQAATFSETVDTPKEVEGAYKVGEYRVGEKGAIVRINEKGQAIDATPKRQGAPDKAAVKRITGLIGIRDARRALVALMRSETATDEEIKKSQRAMKKVYDAFTKEYGPLNAPTNKRMFDKDPDAAAVRALEVLKPTATEVKNKKGDTVLRIRFDVVGLADIFTKRTINAPREIQKADTAEDALLASLGSRAAIDWAYMARITGRTAGALQKELKAAGKLFEQPDGSWAIAEEYLSGDVVTKLRDVETAAALEISNPSEKGDRTNKEIVGRWAPNIKALRAIQPKAKTLEDVESGDLQVSLGANWVPKQDVAKFIADELNGNGPISIHTDNAETFSKWTLEYGPASQSVRESNTHPLAVKYGPKYNDVPSMTYGFIELVNDALNLNSPDLGHWEGYGDSRKWVKDPVGTEAARANVDEVRNRWQQWLFANRERLQEHVNIYNERFNRYVRRTYDGSHLLNIKDGVRTEALPGFAWPYPLYPHQTNVVWRILTTGNTLPAHEVGAGKTLEMIIAAMEMRRTGRARKPLITVPTNLLGQWREAVMAAYPGAKLLAFDSTDLDADKRQEAMSRISHGDWDIVLVPHSSFGLLKVSDERMAAVLQELIDEILNVEAGARQQRGDKDDSVKKIEGARKRLEKKLQKKLDAIEKKKASDKALVWEDLGVDALFVDEAHVFKNLYFYTQLENIRGLSRSESDRALDLFIKVKDINEQSNYRNLVLATATPLMNSMAEVYTMQRYLQPNRLRELGFENFDNWYRTFAEAALVTEQRPDGSYQEVRRLKHFRNLDLLYTTFAEVMDYVGWPDMPYLKLPALEGGRVHIVQTEPHPVYPQLQKWFADRLQNIKDVPPHYDYNKGIYIAPDRPHPFKKNETIPGKVDNVLTIMKDATYAAIDPRLIVGVGDEVADWKGSRIQKVADDVKELWAREKAKKGVQLLFLDVGTPKEGEAGGLEFLRDVRVEDDSDGGSLGVEDQAVEGEEDVETEDAAAFNLYADVKAALVKRGIPSREIAFIHQAKNAAERLALFQAAREGRIRVLLASTDKGGVGMNIQDKLVHVAHIDVPRAMRPGDIRQRDGRGIRQGNTYDKIRVSRYVTKGTTDEWLYGLLASKSHAIEQFMRGKLANFTDEDASTRSIEEAQARAAGDARGIELIELRAASRRLESQASAYERSQASARADISTYGPEIPHAQQNLDAINAWLEKSHVPIKGNAFSMDVGGATYATRAGANEAIMATLEARRNEFIVGQTVKEFELGTIGGMRILASKPHGWTEDVTITLRGGPISITATAIDIPKKSDQKFGEGRNVVSSLTDKYNGIVAQRGFAESRLADAQGRVDRAKRLLDQPADAINKFKKSQERIAELERELKAESAAKEAALQADRKAEKEAEKERIGASAVPVLDEVEKKAKERIEKRGTFKGGRLNAGLPADDITDLAIIGAVKIAKGVVKFAQWAEEMVEEFGEAIRPHLARIYEDAQRRAETEMGPRPIRVPSGRPVPPAKEIPEDRKLEFPSIQKMPEEIRPELEALLERFGGFERQRRGVQSWERTEELAKDVWLPLETLKTGTALNAEELAAYKNALATVMTKRNEVLERVKGVDATERDRLEFMYLTDVATTLTASYRGAKAEAGRALNILRAPARVLELGESAFLNAALARMKDPQSRDAIDAVIRASVAAQGDPLKQLQLLRRRASGNWFDVLAAIYYANLLSGVKTHLRNAIGNSFNVLANLATPVGAAPADFIKSKAKGTDRSVYLSEIPHSVAGAWVGLGFGLKNGFFALRHGFRKTEVDAAEAGKFDTPMYELPGGLLNPFNWPFRALNAADEFYRNIAKYQELYAGAYVQARQDGATTHRQIADRMAELLTATDPTTVDGGKAQALITQANEFAARAVFQEEPGWLTKYLLKLKQPTTPLWVRAPATVVLPFIKTPANIFRQGFEWSPAGFVMRDARTDGRKQSQALGRAAMGSAFILGPLAYLAAQGLITGAAPDDEGEREEFYALGKQANAVRIGNHWVRYSLFQPFSVAMAAVANAYQKFADSDKGDGAAQEAMAAAVAGTGASMLDQSFLSGLGTLIDAVQDPNRYAGRWLALTAQGAVPFSGMARNITHAVDPTFRRPEGVKESLQAIIPGQSDKLTPTRTRFGEEAKREGGPLHRGFVVPEVTKAASDELTLTLARLQVRLHKPDAKLTRRGEAVTLTKEQKDVLAEALGKEVKVALEDRLAHIKGRSDEVQVEILERAMAIARQGVRTRALRALDRNTFTLGNLLSTRANERVKTDGSEFLGSR